MSSIADRLNKGIEKRRVPKIAVLAHDLGVDESAISRWRRGGAMSLSHAASLCRVLDISMDWLILDRGEMDIPLQLALTSEERELVSAVRILPRGSVELLCKFLTMLVESREARTPPPPVG